MPTSKRKSSSPLSSFAELVGDAVEEAAATVDAVVDQLPGVGRARVIKRYANRKLYDPAVGAFTTLSMLEELVRAGVDLRVVDHDSGEDLTPEILGQIADRVARTGRGSEALQSYIRSPEAAAQAIEDSRGTQDEVRALRAQVSELSDLVQQLLAERSERGNNR